MYVSEVQIVQVMICSGLLLYYNDRKQRLI